MTELQMISPLLIALLPGLWAFGHIKRMFWVTAALVFLPLLLVIPGSMLLGTMGLAWRSGVVKWSGLCFLAGIVVLFIWCGAYLWREVPGKHWRRPAVWFSRSVIFVITCALCVAFSLFSSLVVLFAADMDHTQERDGQTVVVQYLWMDGCNYYAYHGPLVRGTELLEGSEDLLRQQEREAEDALRAKVLKVLDIESTSGVVEASIDTHGGFHNDGETFVQLYFTGDTVAEQIAASPDWMDLPLPEELTALAQLSCRDEDSPFLPAVEHGWYWFQDRQAEDAKDYSGTLDRHSYNFTLALYDAGQHRLYYWKLDT